MQEAAGPGVYAVLEVAVMRARPQGLRETRANPLDLVHVHKLLDIRNSLSRCTAFNVTCIASCTKYTSRPYHMGTTCVLVHA